MRSRSRPVPAELWTDPRHRRGLWGERIAIAFLSDRGWRVEVHRFRAGRHDLDIVARRGELVAFVEVKTRGSSEYGAPAESVDWRKRRTLARVAEVYDREVQMAIKRFLSVLEPVLILSLAVMIGGIVFSILMGVMGMSELVV